MRNKIPYNIIVKAVSGDSIAITSVIKHFGAYITALSKVDTTDEFGNKFTIIDEYIRSMLQTKLITKISSFNLHRKY